MLLTARATLAEHADQPHQALDVLAPLLDLEEFPFPWYRWLPQVARLAVLVSDRKRQAALRRFTERRTEQSLPVEARMLLTYCHAILTESPDDVRAFAAFCRTVGGLDLMRAQALADAAWLLARRGNAREAREALGDAVACYRAIGATADIRRAEAAVQLHTPTRAVV